MDDTTISALGGFCKGLIDAEAFDAITKLYSQQVAVDILNTKPHETKAREQLYASYLGFENFISLVKKFAEAHDKLHVTADQQTSAHYDIDDPSVHDIYREDV